ncbi:hypothetical protein ACFL96_11715 [Thermoproteota archaeon]
MDHLEPKCSKCEIKIVIDETIEWSDAEENYVCKKCGTVVENLPAF